MTDDPTSDDLRQQEAEHITTEHEAVQPDEAHAARRRAEKAAYLAEKLEEREEADAVDAE